MRRKPYSVVLLDEIEKAHPDVFNILLQVLDDGILTDGLGRRVDFRNTIVIMTSNIGSPHIVEGVRDGALTPEAEEAVMGELRVHFRPEFLNRVDETILFKPLSVDEIEHIVELMVEQLRQRLADRQISLSLTDEARRFIAESGYDRIYGARPLRRYLQRELETRVGRALIAGEVGIGAVIQVGVEAKEGSKGLKIDILAPHPSVEEGTPSESESHQEPAVMS